MKIKKITGIIFRTKYFLRQSKNYQNYVEGKNYVDSILSNSFPSLLGKNFINTHIYPSETKKKINMRNKFYLPEGGEKTIIENNSSTNLFQNKDIKLDNLLLPKINKSLSMKKIDGYKDKKVSYSSIFKKTSGIFYRNLRNQKLLNISKSAVDIMNSNRNPEGIIFQQEFFNSTSRFYNLNYEPNKIFNKSQYYEKIIKNHLIKLKERNYNENLTYYLEKELNNNKGNNVILQIYSINIKFENLKDKKEYNTYLPFSLIPIFYCYDIISIEEIKLIYSMIITLNKDFKDLILLDDTLLFKYLSMISIPKNNFIYKHNQFYEKLVFPWYTKNVTYKVTITLPTAYIKVVEKNVTFHKIINYELLFYIFNKNFINWDFYIFNYFFSFKIFRILIGKALSYNYRNNFENINKNLSYNPKTLTYEDLRLNSYFFIGTTDEGLNEIYKLKPGYFTLNVNLIDEFKEEYVQREKIFLNLSQTKILCGSIKKIKNSTDFFRKFFNVSFYNNKEKLFFDFDYEKFNEINIDEFAIKMNENKYYEKDKKDKKEKKEEKVIEKFEINDVFSMDFTIEINQPIIEIYNKKIDGILYQSGQIQLNEEDSYNLFCETSIFDWPKILIENIIPKYKVKSKAHINRLKTGLTHNSVSEIKSLISKENLNKNKKHNVLKKSFTNNSEK